MGFSSEVLFIKPVVAQQELLELFAELHGEEFIEVAQTNVSQADRRNSFGIFSGSYNGATIILNVHLLGKRDENLCTDTERKLVQLFPNSEMLTIANYESSNSYSYHFIKSGKTIRLKAGYHPNVDVDFGDELELERNFYVKKEVENGETLFYLNAYNRPGELEKYTHDQIGGSVAFELAKLMTGVNYNNAVMLEVQIKQYIPKAELERFIGKFNFPELNTYEISPYWNDKLLVKQFQKVVDHIKIKVEGLGFLFDAASNRFIRTIEKIQLVIDLKCLESGNYFVLPTLRYYASVDYQNWYFDNFGRNYTRWGQRIINEIPIVLNELGISKTNISIFNHQFNIQTVLENIDTVLEQEVIPFMNKLAHFSSILDYTKGFLKIDLAIMTENRKAALTNLDSVLELIVSTTAQQTKIDQYLLELADRATLLQLDLNVEEEFNRRRAKLS